LSRADARRCRRPARCGLRALLGEAWGCDFTPETADRRGGLVLSAARERGGGFGGKRCCR
jgi:hypothetical protein